MGFWRKESGVFVFIFLYLRPREFVLISSSLYTPFFRFGFNLNLVSLSNMKTLFFISDMAFVFLAIKLIGIRDIKLADFGLDYFLTTS